MCYRTKQQFANRECSAPSVQGLGQQRTGLLLHQAKAASVPGRRQSLGKSKDHKFPTSLEMTLLVSVFYNLESRQVKVANTSHKSYKGTTNPPTLGVADDGQSYTVNHVRSAGNLG